MYCIYNKMYLYINIIAYIVSQLEHFVSSILAGKVKMSAWTQSKKCIIREYQVQTIHDVNSLLKKKLF